MDAGIDACKTFLETLFHRTNDHRNKTYIDYKSIFRNFIQEHSHESPQYKSSKARTGHERHLGYVYSEGKEWVPEAENLNKQLTERRNDALEKLVKNDTIQQW